MALSSTSTIIKSYNAARRMNIDNMKIGAVIPNSNLIVGLNRKQIRSGKTASGAPINPKYSREYNKMKLQMSSYKAPSMTPDLFVTGDFQNAMQMNLSSTKYTILSRDVKAGDLFKRYKDIMGLDTENKMTARVKVTNLFLKNIHVYLGTK
jgi:hypothetical protein